MSMPLLNGIAAFKRATAPALLTKYASIPVVHVLFGVIRERTDKTPEAEGDGPHFETLSMRIWQIWNCDTWLPCFGRSLIMTGKLKRRPARSKTGLYGGYVLQTPARRGFVQARNKAEVIIQTAI